MIDLKQIITSLISEVVNINDINFSRLNIEEKKNKLSNNLLTDNNSLFITTSNNSMNNKNLIRYKGLF